MKNKHFCAIFYFLLSALAAIMAFSRPVPASDDSLETVSSQTVRLVTYNIRACRGLDDSVGLDPHWSGEVLSNIEPDVAGIQEVDRDNSRSNGEDQMEELSKITGLSPVFAKSIEFAGGEYGIGLLTKLPIISVQHKPLPGAEEGRVLLEVEFADFVFFNTHLSLTSESRAESAEIIKSELCQYRKPVILVGDMNVASYEELIELFGETWAVLSPNEPSFPADNPTERLDYIMIADPTQTIPATSPVWSRAVMKQGVIETNASDHRPVFVDLDLALIKSAN